MVITYQPAMMPLFDPPAELPNTLPLQLPFREVEGADEELALPLWVGTTPRISGEGRLFTLAPPGLAVPVDGRLERPMFL